VGRLTLAARLLAVAERLREEADDIKQGRGTPCACCTAVTYSPDEVARFKLRRNLAESADKLERLATDASKIGLE